MSTSRVMLVADRMEHGQAGTERQLARLAGGLAEAGWEARLAVLRQTEYTRDGGFPAPVEELGIGSLSRPDAWLAAARFARSLRRRGFPVAHLFFNDASLLLPPFLAAAGIAVAASRRDMGFWHTPGQVRVLRAVRPFVRRVVANSRAVAEMVGRTEGYGQDRVTVIHNALDPQFGAGLAPDLAVRRVGLVANIRPVKRIEDAVAAFARIAARYPDAQLEVVGGGDAAPLARLAEELGIGDRVLLRGPVEDPAPAMARFSVGLLTSETEGFSNTLMEYQQMGLAVVSSDGGGNPELVRDGETGLLYPAGDVEALAGCLDRLLADEALRRRLGTAGQASVARLCDPARALEAHMDLYRALGAAAPDGERSRADRVERGQSA